MMFTVNDSPLTGEGQYPHVAAPEGAAGARARVERRPSRRADRGSRLVPGLRPRPLAPLGPDRDDAARGLRARRRQARGHLPHDQRRALRAVRVPRRGRPARPHRAGHRAGRHPSRRDGQDGREGRLCPPRVPHPRPRPDRPAQPADERHAGRGHHASQLPRLPAVQGRGAPPRQRRDGQPGARHRSSPSHWTTSSSEARCSSRPETMSTRG